MNNPGSHTNIDTIPRISNGRAMRLRFGLLVAVVGLLLFELGAEPGLIGLDRSPVTGFVQIAVFLVGQGLICVGGAASLSTLWSSNTKSILYDIGLRLVATGFVIAVASGMADIFGFGSQTLPAVPRFGAWQKYGVIIGQFVIGVGFLLMIRYPRWLKLKIARRTRKKSQQT